MKLNEESKTKMQAGEARVLAQVEFVRAALEHLGSPNLIFPLCTSNLDPEHTDLVLDPTTIPLPHNEATDLPCVYFYFHAYHVIAYALCHFWIFMSFWINFLIRGFGSLTC